jgi:hypothetical protein
MSKTRQLFVAKPKDIRSVSVTRMACLSGEDATQTIDL